MPGRVEQNVSIARMVWRARLALVVAGCFAFQQSRCCMPRCARRRPPASANRLPSANVPAMVTICSQLLCYSCSCSSLRRLALRTDAVTLVLEVAIACMRWMRCMCLMACDELIASCATPLSLLAAACVVRLT